MSNTTVKTEVFTKLLKIKIQDGCEESKDVIAEKIVGKVNVVLVQILGNTLLFYKPFEEPEIVLPSS